MPDMNIIERAFELARTSANVEDVRKALKREGYSGVDMHLAGASIRADLRRQLGR